MEHYDTSATDAQNAEDMANAAEDEIETIVLAERVLENTLIEFSVIYEGSQDPVRMYQTFRRDAYSHDKMWIDPDTHETLEDAILDAVSHMPSAERPADHEIMRMEAQILDAASHTMKGGKS